MHPRQERELTGIAEGIILPVVYDCSTHTNTRAHMSRSPGNVRGRIAGIMILVAICFLKPNPRLDLATSYSHLIEPNFTQFE